MKKNKFELSLATPAIGFDDFSGLRFYKENNIRYVEVTPILPDNKAWIPLNKESTKNFLLFCKNHSVIPNSVHSYFLPALGHCMTDNDEEARKNAVEMNRQLFWGAAEIGAKYMVIHLSDSMIHYDSLEINVDRARYALESLFKAAEETGVKIAVENIHKNWSVKEINSLLDEYNHPMAGICLDTGHAALYTNLADEVISAGERLLGFHIHDNNLNFDQHLIPFRGKINWANFAESISMAGYNGILTLESYTRTNDDETIESYINHCRKAFDKIVEMI